MPIKFLAIKLNVEHQKHIVASVFFIVFCSISLVNHYNYRTYALDLGLFNQSIWNYAHFNNANYTILNELYNCQLGDHLSLYFILVSPFYWAFGSYTLLLFQVLAIVFGGYGIYKYAELKHGNNNWLPLLFMIQFFGIWGIISALSYDYHDNVVAAMLVPWFIYYFETSQIKKIILFFILILISKENMALWMFFISIGLIISSIKDKKKLKLSIILSIISIVYFIVVIKFLLPAINIGHGYIHMNYSVLGNNPIKSFFSNPHEIINAFFNNHLNNPYFDGIKNESFMLFLFSGGVLLIFKPKYLIMLVPIFAQKMFSDDPGKWGINGHYSVEFAPIITLGVIEVFVYGKKFPKALVGLSFILIYYTYKSHYDKLETRTSLYYSKINSQFYDKAHYQSNYSISAINEAKNLIPDSSKICATSVLLPHIEDHRNIYQYPISKDADCFFLLEKPESFYMFTQQDLDKQLSYLRMSEEWATLYDRQGVCLFKKK